MHEFTVKAKVIIKTNPLDGSNDEPDEKTKNLLALQYEQMFNSIPAVALKNGFKAVARVHMGG